MNFYNNRFALMGRFTVIAVKCLIIDQKKCDMARKIFIVSRILVCKRSEFFSSISVDWVYGKVAIMWKRGWFPFKHIFFFFWEHRLWWHLYYTIYGPMFLYKHEMCDVLSICSLLSIYRGHQQSLCVKIRACVSFFYYESI